MKVNEFIDKYKKANVTQSIKTLLAVKSYLPYQQKQNFADYVLSKSKVVNHGYIQFDEVKKYMVFTIEVLKTYTNLEFDEDFNVAITEYDSLCAANVLNSIIETFEGEYNSVLNMVNMRQEYILQENNIEFQVIKFLNELNEKLGFAIDSIADNFNSFNDIGVTSEDINKLTSFIGSLGK